MRYELYYWPSIQGRGEFVRLALEEAGAEYVDVAREPDGMTAMMKLLQDSTLEHPPFAPPFLKCGDLIVSQTPNILMYLGAHHGLAPTEEAGRLWTHQLQLTMADFLLEIHDTHHPVGSGLYYEEQKAEALRKSADFRKHRAPKFLDYFERVLTRNDGGNDYLVGDTLTYADLSMFQILSGLDYAFPLMMARLNSGYPKLRALHDRVAPRPRISAYLRSQRRIPFNQEGIFRHYPDLDGA